MTFNKEITNTDFKEREELPFLRTCEINKAKVVSANITIISKSKILNATVFEGVLKLTSLSNSELFGNISGIRII